MLPVNITQQCLLIPGVTINYQVQKDGTCSAELHALRSRVIALTQLAAGKNPETNELECGKVSTTSCDLRKFDLDQPHLLVHDKIFALCLIQMIVALELDHIRLRGRATKQQRMIMYILYIIFIHLCIYYT